MLYGSFCGPAIVLIHLDLGLQGICVGFHYLVQMGTYQKKKTYNWVIFLQTHFLFVNSLGFIGKGSIRKRQAKKKKNMFDVCLQAQPMRHELITWCRLSPLREVRK